MIQGSAEWHAWRREGIGSSDAPAVLGVSPYATREDVMLDKLGLAPARKSNPAMELGSKWEAAARAIYFFETGIELVPAEITHPQFHFLIASLDGLAEGVFAEIKYMGEKNFEEVLKTHKPLDHHWVQIQHQCLVTEIKRCVYIAYTLSNDYKKIDRIQYVDVFMDEKYCVGAHFLALHDFWQEVMERRSKQKELTSEKKENA